MEKTRLDEQLDRLGQVRDYLVEMKELVDVDRTKLSVANMEEALKQRIQKDRVYTIQTDNKAVAEFFGGRKNIQVTSGESIQEEQDFDWSWFPSFDFDFGSRIFLRKPLIAFAHGSSKWGVTKWTELLSLLPGSVVDFEGQYSSAHCYRFVTTRQIASILLNCDFFVGEPGWIATAADMIGRLGVVVGSGSYKTLATVCPPDGIDSLSVEMVETLFKQIAK